MTYILMFLPPVTALVVLIVALHSGFNKSAFIISISITMALVVVTMEKLTWYGMICMLIIPLAVVYTLLALYLSIKERREDDQTIAEEEVED